MSKSRFATVRRTTLGIGALALILTGTARAQIAQMTSPTPGTILPGASVTFTWTTGTNAQQYYLYVGTVYGGNDIYGMSQGTSTMATVTNLPTNGSTLYVRLWSLVSIASGNVSVGWNFNSYTYTTYTASQTAESAIAQMTSPTPGTILPGASVAFTWTTGTNVQQYYLYVGTVYGGNDIYGMSQGTSTMATVTNLPTNGSTLYVRLWSFVSIASSNLSVGWNFNDYTYTASQPESALQFVPVTPCRVLDTRSAAGPFGGPSIAGQTSRSFIIPDSACGIPATAAAYSLNVTVVPQTALGYLTVWPSGEAQPVVSTLNSLDARVKANSAIVPAGANGAVSIFASNTTDVIVDINGYFVLAGTTPSALAFYPTTPCRIADTRTSNGAFGTPSLVALGTRDFPINHSACGVPISAQAYSLNFTVVPPSAMAYLTVWPAGQAQPVVSTLNDLVGQVIANAAIVPAGTNGDINVFATQETDLVIDINGYFAPPGTGGLSLYDVTPCRVLDTRKPSGTLPFTGKDTLSVIGSACAPPATAQAFVFNATVVPPAPLGYLTLWADGEAQLTVSTLNALDGAITNNMALVPTTNGSIDIFASNPTHLVLDLFGYFAP